MPEMTRTIPPALGQGQRVREDQPGCEWNPDAALPARPGCDHHLYALATWSVEVPEDGTWKLCNPCSQKPPFKGFIRVRLPKTKP